MRKSIIKDTARFASTRLCQIHEDDLLGSSFRFYLSLQKGLRYPEIFEIKADDPPPDSPSAAHAGNDSFPHQRCVRDWTTSDAAHFQLRPLRHPPQPANQMEYIRL